MVADKIEQPSFGDPLDSTAINRSDQLSLHFRRPWPSAILSAQPCPALFLSRPPSLNTGSTRSTPSLAAYSLDALSDSRSLLKMRKRNPRLVLEVGS